MPIPQCQRADLPRSCTPAGAGRQIAGVAIDWALVCSAPSISAALLFHLDFGGFHPDGNWAGVMPQATITALWPLALAVVQIFQLNTHHATIGQRLVGVTITDVSDGYPASVKRTALLRPLGWVGPALVGAAWTLVALWLDLDNSGYLFGEAAVLITTYDASYGSELLAKHRLLADCIAGTRVIR